MKIESGIEIQTPARTGRKPKYPFLTMKVGDSFFLAGKSAGKIRAAAADHGRRHGTKFSTRTVENGVRCWRIK